MMMMRNMFIWFLKEQISFDCQVYYFNETDYNSGIKFNNDLNIANFLTTSEKLEATYE